MDLMGESARADLDLIASRCEKCGGRCELDRSGDPQKTRLRCVACEHIVDAPMVAAMPGQWTVVDPGGVVRLFSSWQELVAALPMSGTTQAVESSSGEKSVRASSAAALLDVTPSVPPVAPPPAVTPSEAPATATSSSASPPRLALVPADDPPPLPRSTRPPENVEEPIADLPDEDVMPASSRDATALLAAGLKHKRVTGFSVPPPLPPGASTRPPALITGNVSAPPPAPKGGTLKTLPPSARRDVPPPPTIDVDSEPAFKVSESELEVAPDASAPAVDQADAVTAKLTPGARSKTPSKSEPRVPAKAKAKADAPPSAKASGSSTKRQPSATPASASTPKAEPEATGRGWLMPVGAVAIVAAIIAYVMHGSTPASNGTPNPNEATEARTAPASTTPPTTAPTSTSTASPTPTASVATATSAVAPSASTTGAPRTAAEKRALGDSQLSLPEVLERAAAARKSGDLAHTKALLERALELSPGNAEAHGLLGDLARSQGDNAGAKASYQKALATSPSYFPAALGLADAQWDLGDRDAARRGYKDLIGSGRPVPERVKERATPSTSAPPASAAETATPPAPAPAPAPTTEAPPSK